MLRVFPVSHGRVPARMLHRSRARAAILFLGFLALGLAGAPSAEAACPGIIPSGGTETTTQDLPNNGDSCTVEQGGAISTNALDEDGITGGGGNTVTNNGIISTEGADSEAINLEGGNNTVTNNGSISTIGGDAIAVSDGGNTVTNNGSVTTNGGTSNDAINASGGGNTVTNNGTASTTGGSSDAINVSDGGNTVTNNGTASATGGGSDAINVSDGGNTVTNNGTASATGGGRGITADDGDNTIINSGLISATGDSDRAINFGGVDDGGNELILRPGSRIIGKIRTASSNNAPAITFQNRVSTVITISNGIPGPIDSNGLPFVVSGDTVAVLDPSGFNQHDEMLSDLTSGIFNSVHARLASATIPVAPQRVGKGFVEPVVSKQAAVWAQVFGGWREEDNTGPTNGADHDLVGGIAGIDGLISPTTRIGAFGGGARGDVNVNFNSQDIDADSYFGGVYANFKNAGWFADMILTAGQTDHDSKRTVMYNLAPTGRPAGPATMARSSRRNWLSEPDSQPVPMRSNRVSACATRICRLMVIRKAVLLMRFRFAAAISRSGRAVPRSHYPWSPRWAAVALANLPPASVSGRGPRTTTTSRRCCSAKPSHSIREARMTRSPALWARRVLLT